ncbi:hypothetical protein [Planococcus sp. YIM B11945]|uniref:hypothetical protein n=1 Tax=Planococcus sp. YIM B11945 TaxID=3435410 RepID=UPI003D7D5D76
MKLAKIQSVLYKASRLVGDVKAIKNGTFPQRIAQRTIRRAANRMLDKLFKI